MAYLGEQQHAFVVCLTLIYPPHHGGDFTRFQKDFFIQSEFPDLLWGQRMLP
jgi:hypothetical protein